MPESAPRSVITLAVLCSLLVLAGVGMIVFGLPEQTLLQKRLLQLYSVPWSGALGLGIAHRASQLDPVPGVTRRVLQGAAGLLAVGVATMFAGILLDDDGLLPLGQAILWVTLVATLIHLVVQGPKRGGRAFELEPADDERADQTTP